MAMLFAEKGLDVSLSDPSEDAINKIIKNAEKEGFGERIHKSKGNHTARHVIYHLR